MADRLAKLYGTQMDKMGACRYGDSCQRIHNKPPISQTICLKHMYENNAIETALIDGNNVSRADADAAMTKSQNFYEEIFRQMMKYGQIQDMIVVDNMADHIVGNVYVKYSQEDYAENAQKNTNGRFFNGKKIQAQFSPVTDFLNAKCKQHIEGTCKRGGYCNYMHIKPLSKSFKKQLFASMYIEHPEYRIKKKIEESSDDDWRQTQRIKEKKKQKAEREKDQSKSKSKSKSRDKKHKDKKKKRKRSQSQQSRSSQKEPDK